MNLPYLFTSARLGFRQWHETDIPQMAHINADPLVMEFFPNAQTLQQTADFVQRMQNQFLEKGFCYYAVDVLKTQEFIGFIGLSEQTFTADFTPCVDMGWRLSRAHWNQGYATEGAKRCLEHAFGALYLNSVKAIAPKANVKSERVMQKIGMQKVKEFLHPLLVMDERLKVCLLYEITP